MFVVNGQEIHVTGSLLLFLADTLAAHQVGGFKVGVGFSHRKCRNCLATSDEIQEKVCLSYSVYTSIMKFVAMFFHSLMIIYFYPVPLNTMPIIVLYLMEIWHPLIPLHMAFATTVALMTFRYLMLLIISYLKT